MFVRKRSSELCTPKQCITVPKRTSFSSFYMHLGSEMLQNNPKHQLDLMEAIGCSCENVRRNFGTSKQCISVQNTPVSHRFVCIGVAKCSKTLPNIIFGLMEAIGCVRAKTFVGTLYPETVHYYTKTHQFLIVLHAFG